MSFMLNKTKVIIKIKKNVSLKKKSFKSNHVSLALKDRIFLFLIESPKIKDDDQTS